MAESNSRKSFTQNFQETHQLIWLEKDFDQSNQENQEFLSKMKKNFSEIQLFSNINLLKNYLKENSTKQSFLIITDDFLDEINSLEKNYSRLTSIYILSLRNQIFQDSKKNFVRGRGIFTSRTHLFNRFLRNLREIEESFFPINSISNSTNDRLDPEFIYCQLMKDQFLQLDNQNYSLDEFIAYAQQFCLRNGIDKTGFDTFKTKYQSRTNPDLPIECYKDESFLYAMLNKALRDFNVEALMKLSFFIRDLHLALIEKSKRNKRQFQILYRGQFMSKEELEKKKKIGNLWYFNCFLSTSQSDSTAREFLSSRDNPGLTKLFLKIQVDPSNNSVPFTFIDDLGHPLSTEQEVLFSMGSVFRLEKITENPDENLCHIELTLTSDRDPILMKYHDYLKLSLDRNEPWQQLAALLIQVGHLGLAKEIYSEIIKTKGNHQPEQFAFLHHQLGFIEKRFENYEKAFEHFQLSLNEYSKILKPNDPKLSSLYSNIGSIYKDMKRFEEAIQAFEYALNLDQNAEKPNQLEIAIDYNNIATVYEEQGKYPEALKYYKKSLEIKSVIFPNPHPSKAKTLLGIGLVHRKMGDQSSALSFYQRGLEIQQKTLPENHPDFIITHSNMASVLDQLDRFDEALGHATKAENIAKLKLTANHPEIKRQSEICKIIEERRRSRNNT